MVFLTIPKDFNLGICPSCFGQLIQLYHLAITLFCISSGAQLVDFDSQLHHLPRIVASF